ncbi:MAG: ABC transporter substrate-binding protein, partial [Candidatus Atribacteria bacterium]|nr:ABC transporter substrate-binding protein [Candidatus Atribacteria bacterium]
MKKRIFLILLLTFVLMFGILTSASASGVLVFGSSGDASRLDPGDVTDGESIQRMDNIFEGLVEYEAGSVLIQPCLATSWEASADGTEIVFNLRKGVKFHDGTAFTAEAVKFSIERTKKIGKGAAFIWADLKEILVVHDYTVKLVLKKPVPLPQIAASAYASYIMSPKVGDKDSAWFNKGNDAGSGPYTLKNYKNGESWMLAKFDGYWAGWDGKHIENILVKFTKEPLTQLQMLQAGQAMLVGRIPLDSYSSVKNGKITKVLYGPSYQNYMAFFNTTRPPLDNVKVRKALAHAIPYDDIITIGFNGNASQARGPVPQGQFGGTNKVTQYKYDLKKAEKLLAEAGHAGGGFKLTLTYAAENAQEARFAPLIQSEFKKLGVDVEIKALAWSTQWAMAKKDPKTAQDIFLLLWWPTYSDPYETLYTLLRDEGEKPVWNLAYYKNAPYEKMIREAYETIGSNPEKALGLYVNAQNLIQKDSPAAWIADVRENWPMNKR